MFMQTREKLALALILLVLLSRLIPHPANFTPVLSIALFAGANFQKKWLAFAIPMLGLVLGNIVLGFQPISWIVVGIMALITGLGFLLKSSKSGKMDWLVYSLFASLGFFIVSNFFVWATTGMYPKSFSGLVSCYLMAIPFFKNTLISTGLYSVCLFAGQKYFEHLLQIWQTRKAI